MSGAPGPGDIPPFCDHCGGALAGGDHESCRRSRELEPPRFCGECARRLVVQVVPRGWSARCSRHGVIGSAVGARVS
jgi:hypothetical protein